MAFSVAIISPDPDTRKMLALYLELKGAVVHQFADSGEFRAKDIEAKDLTIVLDLVDKKSAGDELPDLSTASRHGKAARTIIILPRGVHELGKKCHASRACKIVIRPFELIRLAEVVLNIPRRSSSSRRSPRRRS